MGLDFIVYVILGLACGRARLDHGVLLWPCRLPSHSRYRWVFSRGLLGASRIRATAGFLRVARWVLGSAFWTLVFTVVEGGPLVYAVYVILGLACGRARLSRLCYLG